MTQDPRTQRPYEALSPVQIEQRLSHSISDLTRAEAALRAARDQETDAEIAYRYGRNQNSRSIAYRSAFYRATLDKHAPEVSRGGYTVAERDAWVGLRCREQWEAYRRAQTVREAAQDHLRTVRDITEVLRSLGASVRTAYEGAGYQPR